jgi:hypothetical protein
MALPQLNDTLKYSLQVPSTKKKVSFRPFLVKEQKILLVALESQDESMILQSIVDTIKSCVYDEIDEKDLATFDVEYMFTQIRAKSVGETTDINLSCNKCEEPNEVKILLTDIDIELTNSKVLELNETYSLQMRYPSYKHMVELSNLSDLTQTDQLLELCILCSEYILTEDEQINIQEESKEDITTFFESLNNEQFDKIVKFVMDLPKLKKVVDFKCTKCSEDNNVAVEGLQSFLS